MVMTMADTDSFPRGARPVSKEKPKFAHKRKQTENLFQVGKVVKRKKTKKRRTSGRNSDEDEATWEESLDLRGTLTYSKIQEGMVILGCIRRISNLTLQVELPGLTSCRVAVNAISEPFTKVLTKQIEEPDADPNSVFQRYFEIGQLVPVKILSLEKSPKFFDRFDINASLDPKDVNSGKLYNSFKKGTTVWATVQSELDHGYELSFGVKNCRVFLPLKNVDVDVTYEVGQLLFCVVHKFEESDSATTVTVSCKKEHLDKVQLKEDQLLYNLVPGMKVDVLIEDVTDNGVKGRFLDDYVAYIDQSHFFSILKKRPKEGKRISAYILFTDPITNITYMTLRGLETLPGAQLPIGKITQAKIARVPQTGLRLILEENVAGYINNNRLLKCIQKTRDSDFDEVIATNYPVGSKHFCRILDYNRMDDVYICTFESDVINEKYFTASDLHLGLKVSGEIEQINDGGLVVRVGRLKGFVPNLHISNVEFTPNIKAKFTKGSQVEARVLNIPQEENIILTLKQGLLDCEDCLISIDDIEVSKRYTGFIVKTTPDGALVCFYGTVSGWISRQSLMAGSAGNVSPQNYFFRGQVVNVWVLSVKEGKVSLSIDPPEELRKLDRRKETTIKRNSKFNEETKQEKSDETKKEASKKKRKTSEAADDSGNEIVEMVSKKKKKKKKKSDAEEKSEKKKELTELVFVEDAAAVVKVSKKKKKTVETAEEDKEPILKKSKKIKIVSESLDNDTEAVPKKKSKEKKIKELERVESDSDDLMNEVSASGAPILSGVSSFYTLEDPKPQDTSSDEEPPDVNQKKKKKKLTREERRELARQEEERISKIEKELANSSGTPQSAEQFDRVLLANPNSSELWLKYMAMHVATTELDKARTVGRKALDTIKPTEIKEKLNVWIALLNLENMYGTRETFDHLFDEAVKYNDSFEIYMSVIKMFANTGKLSEMEEKIRKVRAKEKQNPKMWLEIGRIYYRLGNFKEARSVKEAALKSILIKKVQFDLIVKFGIMEFQHGDLDQAMANFEAIVESYPSKINIWIVYADQLIKKKRIDLAKDVLERAVKQKFPVKAMKTLYDKLNTVNC